MEIKIHFEVTLVGISFSGFPCAEASPAKNSIDKYLSPKKCRSALISLWFDLRRTKWQECFIWGERKGRLGSSGQESPSEAFSGIGATRSIWKGIFLSIEMFLIDLMRNWLNFTYFLSAVQHPFKSYQISPVTSLPAHRPLFISYTCPTETDQQFSVRLACSLWIINQQAPAISNGPYSTD